MQALQARGSSTAAAAANGAPHSQAAGESSLPPAKRSKTDEASAGEQCSAAGDGEWRVKLWLGTVPADLLPCYMACAYVNNTCIAYMLYIACTCIIFTFSLVYI